MHRTRYRMVTLTQSCWPSADCGPLKNISRLPMFLVEAAGPHICLWYHPRGKIHLTTIHRLHPTWTTPYLLWKIYPRLHRSPGGPGSPRATKQPKCLRITTQCSGSRPHPCRNPIGSCTVEVPSLRRSPRIWFRSFQEYTVGGEKLQKSPHPTLPHPVQCLREPLCASETRKVTMSSSC